MAVVGVVILMVLLLILRIIMQTAAAEPPPLPEITEEEIIERIESLEEARREIQDEIAKLKQAEQNAAPYIPSLDQIDALRTSIARLEGDIERIEADIKTAKERQEELNNRPEFKLMQEVERHIRELETLRDDLQRKNDEQTKQQQSLQSKIDELTKRQEALDRQLATDIAKRVFVTPHKTTDKTPHILIYGQGRITVLSQADPIGQSFTSRKAFFDWARSLNRRTEYIVLYVRPSRFEEYESVLDELKKMGFDTGLQVIGEKTEIALQ